MAKKTSGTGAGTWWLPFEPAPTCDRWRGNTG